MFRSRPSAIIPRRLFLGVGVVMGSGILTACQLLGLEWKYRYRLTAEVKKGGKIYRGSSVIEVVRDKGIDGIGGYVRGEAVTVEIPGSGTLFLLLRGEPGGVDWAFTMPHYAFRKQLGSVDMVNSALLDRLTHMQGATEVLTPDLYPKMVRFREVGDPKSVEAIDPASIAASFGANIMLDKIAIQFTNDEITTGIIKQLRWLMPNKEATLDHGFQPTTKPNLAQMLRFTDFIRG